MKKSFFPCGRLSEPHAKMSSFLHAALLRGPYGKIDFSIRAKQPYGKIALDFSDATSYGPHGKMMGPRTEKSFFNSVRLTYAKSAYSCNNSIPLFKRELRTVSNCNSIPNLVQLQVMCNRQRTYIQHKLKQY
jgi:hypothetical protein